MPILLAIIYALFAGIINGSFALPTKHTKQWQFENIWLNYAIFGFLLVPWISIFLLAPNALDVYSQAATSKLLILCVGGLLFGIGQICFAQALKMIGLGLGFVINIGLGTGLGFLLPLIVLHPHDIITPFGLTTIIGCILIIIGLILSYNAGKKRDTTKQTQVDHTQGHYHLGIILSIIAGFFSALQNFTFAATHQLQLLALNAHMTQLAASIIIWPIFLSFTFIPYAIYMLYLHIKNKSSHNYLHSRSLINFLLALIMGLFWYGSLIFYSKASLLIGDLGPIVAWPLFMVCIILTSNFWGWREREWQGCSITITRQVLTAIGLLVFAVLILAYSATLA